MKGTISPGMHASNVACVHRLGKIGVFHFSTSNIYMHLKYWLQPMAHIIVKETLAVEEPH